MKTHKALFAGLLAFLAADAVSAVKTPPDDFFAKPQFSTRFEFALRGAGQKTAEAFADEIASNNIPCGVFALECDWATHPGSMTFEQAEFPDPKAMFGKIRGRGFLPVVSMSSFVSPDSRECRRFRHDPENGGLDHLLRGPDDRTPAILRWRGGCSATWDLTRPAAFGFFLDMLTAFSERYGVAGFLFEAMEPAQMNDARFYAQDQGAAGFMAHYGRLARYFPCSIYDGPGSGVKGAVVRLSPRRHAWKELKLVIPELLARSREGALCCVPDGIGGGSVDWIRPDRITAMDQALFLRSCAMQALMPAMHFSRAPWRGLTPERLEICRGFIRLHASVSQYIVEQVRSAAQTGVPVVRSMDAVFPDQGFNRPLQQFMLGSRYLVAPVVSQDGSVTIEFPAGGWIDPRGMTVEGPKTMKLDKVPLSFLPYFERK